MDYYDLTWREYILTVRGFSIKRSHEFENTRAICHIIYAVNRNPKKAYLSMHEFWPLITDDDESNKIDLKAEERRMRAVMRKYNKSKTASNV